MIRAAVISSAMVAPAAAMACVAPVQSCGVGNGGVAYLDWHEGDNVMFTEFGSPGDTQTERSLLVECSGRTGVMVTRSGAHDEDFWDGQSALLDTLGSPTAETPRQIVARLRRQGIAAERVTLGAGHCGCDLPTLPIPPFDCPDFQ